jgi:hypothetical protein
VLALEPCDYALHAELIVPRRDDAVPMRVQARGYTNGCMLTIPWSALDLIRAGKPVVWMMLQRQVCEALAAEPSQIRWHISPIREEAADA